MIGGRATFRTDWVSERHLRVVALDGADAPAGWAATVGARLLESAAEGVVDVAAARGSIVVEFGLSGMPPEREAEAFVVRRCERVLSESTSVAARVVTVGVCFDAEHAPDLGAVASECGLSRERVIQLLVGAPLRVEFIGFAPGFPYLAGLPPELHLPRLPSPRARVPAGSVAIAGDQCGIYPHATPGGWRLVGRTPLRLFDAGREPPGLLRAGDRVAIRPIDAATFAELTLAEGGLQEMA